MAYRAAKQPPTRKLKLSIVTPRCKEVMIPLSRSVWTLKRWVIWVRRNKNADFWAKNAVFWTKIFSFGKSSKNFVIIMTAGQKYNVFVLTPLHGGPSGTHRGPFLARKSWFFLHYTYITPIIWVRRIWLNGIISPPYPEMTLDNFGFPVRGPLVALRAVFWNPGWILKKIMFSWNVPP